MSVALERIGLIALTAAVGCAASSPASETVGQARAAIVAGDAAVASQDSVVRIVSANNGTYCTGVLVDPQIVLTTQSCLVQGTLVFSGGQSDSTDCALDTTPVPVSSIQEIDFGLTFEAPSLRAPPVKSVVVNAANVSCAQDVAALVLASPVSDPEIVSHIRPLLLDPQLAQIAVNEAVTAVGWGFVNDQGLDPTILQQATGVISRLPGPGPVQTPDGQSIPVGVGFLVSTIKSSAGDFGGPLMDGSGAIIGLLSQNASDETTTVASVPIPTASDSVSLASPLSAAAPFITRVFQSVGRMPWTAPRPAPPAAIGGSCSANDECNSNFCVVVGYDAGGGSCSSPCIIDDASAEVDGGDTDPDAASGALEAVTTCPAPTVCTETGGATPVCLAPSAAPKPRGCSSSGRGGEPVGPGGGALVVLIVGAAACRRKRA